MVTAFTMSAAAKDFTVTSPNGKLFIKIHANQQKLTWEVNHGTTQVLAPSEIGLNGTLQKMDGKVTKNTTGNIAWSSVPTTMLRHTASTLLENAPSRSTARLQSSISWPTIRLSFLTSTTIEAENAIVSVLNPITMSSRYQPCSKTLWPSTP